MCSGLGWAGLVVVVVVFVVQPRESRVGEKFPPKLRRAVSGRV